MAVGAVEMAAKPVVDSPGGDSVTRAAVQKTGQVHTRFPPWTAAIISLSLLLFVPFVVTVAYIWHMMT